MSTDELRVVASMRDEVSGDLRNIQGEVKETRADLNRLDRAGGVAGAGLGKVGAAAGGLARMVKNVLVTALKAGIVALAAIGSAAVVGFGKMIKLAMDAGETISKFRTVFGGAAGEMEAWAKGLSARFGITTKALQDAASTFGVFGQSAGVATKDLPKFSKGLVQAGLDLASFYNVDPGQAFEDLRSGLAGEAEPLRKYGIFLSETALKEQAALAGVTGELTEQQKVAARQAFILSHLGAAQGDLDRTSLSLANQWRALKGRGEELLTVLGGAFEPLVSRLVIALNTGLQPVLERMTALAPRLAEAFRAGDLQAAARIIDEMAGNTGRLLIPLLAIVHAFGPGGGGIAEVFNVLAEKSPVLAALVGIVEMFKDVWAAVWPVLQPLLPLFGLLGKVFVQVLEAVKPYMPEIGRLVTMLVGALLPAVLAIAQAFAPLIPIFLEMVSMLLPPLISLISLVVPVMQALSPLVTELAMAFMPLIPPLVQLVTALMPILVTLGQAVGEVLKPLAPIIKILATVLGWLIENGLIPVVNAFSAVWAMGLELYKFLKEKLLKGFEFVGASIKFVVDMLKGVWEWTKKIGGKVLKAVGIDIEFEKGDTPRPRTPPRPPGAGRLSNLQRTLGAHALIESVTPGSRRITSSIRQFALGSPGSDHPAGKALDLQGPFLAAYARNARHMGAFAEPHGGHLHAAFGDTARPRADGMGEPAGGNVYEVNVYLYGPVDSGIDIERAVKRGIAEAEAERVERGHVNASR